MNATDSGNALIETLIDVVQHTETVRVLIDADTVHEPRVIFVADKCHVGQNSNTPLIVLYTC